MAEQKLAPFRANTRERFLKIGIVNMPSGGGDGQTLPLPQVGYLARIFLLFQGVVSFSASSTYGDLAPFSLLKKITLELNNGAQNICDVSGFGLFLQNMIMRKMAKPDREVDPDFFAAPLSGTNVPFRFGLEIPVNVSEGLNFEAGMINLQAPEIQVNLRTNFTTNLAEIGSNITAFSGQVKAYYKYYEVPNPLTTFQPPVMLHRILEEVKPVNQVGDIDYKVPSGGELLRLIQVLQLNGARSDSYDSRSIKLNLADKVYEEDREVSKKIARDRYGYALPVGCSVWDFARGYGDTEESDKRDVINTEKVTTLQAIHSVQSSAVLGTNNNYLRSIREIIQSVG